MISNITTPVKSMKLSINDNKTIGEIQNDFSSEFPFLKLEFLAHQLPVGATNVKKEILKKTERLGVCRKVHNDGEVELSSEMTVAKLEQIFEKQFGLHAQVFRKSGNVWLITTATDAWTLGVQNQQGKELSEDSPIEPDENIDYHEQE
jgi:hypothetical protein